MEALVEILILFVLVSTFLGIFLVGNAGVFMGKCFSLGLSAVNIAVVLLLFAIAGEGQKISFEFSNQLSLLNNFELVVTPSSIIMMLVVGIFHYITMAQKWPLSENKNKIFNILLFYIVFCLYLAIAIKSIMTFLLLIESIVIPILIMYVTTREDRINRNEIFFFILQAMGSVVLIGVTIYLSSQIALSENYSETVLSLIRASNVVGVRAKVLICLLLVVFMVKLGAFPLHGALREVFQRAIPPMRTVLLSVYSITAFLIYVKYIGAKELNVLEGLAYTIIVVGIIGILFFFIKTIYANNFFEIMSNSVFLNISILLVASSISSNQNAPYLLISYLLIVGTLVYLSECATGDATFSTSSKILTFNTFSKKEKIFLLAIMCQIAGLPGFISFNSKALIIANILNVSWCLGTITSVMIVLAPMSIFCLCKQSSSFCVKENKNGERILSYNEYVVLLIWAISLLLGFLPHALVGNG